MKLRLKLKLKRGKPFPKGEGQRESEWRQKSSTLNSPSSLPSHLFYQNSPSHPNLTISEMDSPNPDEKGKEATSSIPSTPPPAPSLKRPGLVSSNSTQNISGGLDGFLRGAAMTFNQSSPKKSIRQSNSLEDDDDEEGGHSDSTEDSEDSSTDEDDDDEDQESEIARKLKSSDQESLKQVKQSSSIKSGHSTSGGAGAVGIINDPLGSGSGSLSSGEKTNPLESISLTPMTSNLNDEVEVDRDERLGQRIDETGKESQVLETNEKDSKEEESMKRSIKENSQSIDELKRKQNQAEREGDSERVREKGLEASKKEKKKRRALGRLIRRTRGEFAFESV